MAGVALASVLDDPVQAWWRVGCLASGWGRVEAVGRLAELDDELPDEVRGWLLRHACRTAELPDHVAYACATAGRLETALDGLVDDELLDGACAILSGLVTGYAGEDMEDYEPGPHVAVTVLDLLADRPPNVVRMWAVVDLRNWAEDYEQHVAIAERCGRLLGGAEARRFVAARLERPDEALRVWGIAESIGPRSVGGRAGATSTARGSTRVSTPARAHAARRPLGAAGGPRRALAAARRAGRRPRGPPAAHRPATARRRTRSPSSSRRCGPGAGRRRSWRPRC